MAIERLSAGDPVVAFDRAASGRAGRRDDAGRRRGDNRAFVPGAAVVATATHPFAIGPGVFRAADRLRAGDTLFLGTVAPCGPSPCSPSAGSGAAIAYDLLVDREAPSLQPESSSTTRDAFFPTRRSSSWRTRKPIRDVRPGDRVLAFEEDGKVVDALVREILSVEAEGHYTITTSRAELRATSEHPFYVGDGTYKTVEALAEGDTVYAFDGQRLSPQTIRKIARVPGRSAFQPPTDPPNTFLPRGRGTQQGRGGGCFPAARR
jgi:hypothetical protein